MHIAKNGPHFFSHKCLCFLVQVFNQGEGATKYHSQTTTSDKQTLVAPWRGFATKKAVSSFGFWATMFEIRIRYMLYAKDDHEDLPKYAQGGADAASIIHAQGGAAAAGSFFLTQRCLARPVVRLPPSF